MKTYRVKIGGESYRRGHFSNTYYYTIEAESAKEAKSKAIREAKLENTNLPGKTYEDLLSFTTAEEIR